MQCTNYIQKWQEKANENKELVRQLDENKQKLREYDQVMIAAYLNLVATTSLSQKLLASNYPCTEMV